jgi:hypothetical protein
MNSIEFSEKYPCCHRDIEAFHLICPRDFYRDISHSKKIFPQTEAFCTEKIDNFGRQRI